MNKCVFLDRDGVINRDYVDYVYSAEKMEILPGVVESLKKLHNAGYLLVVITNQSGIAKGLYKRENMQECHDIIQEACGGLIEHFYFAPGHPTVSESLSRKPGSLMFEKAIAKYDVDTSKSWMIGDKDRDLVPAKKLNIKTIQVDHSDSEIANHHAADLAGATDYLLGQDDSL